MEMIDKVAENMDQSSISKDPSFYHCFEMKDMVAEKMNQHGVSKDPSFFLRRTVVRSYRYRSVASEHSA